jgi:hypothetical protein
LTPTKFGPKIGFEKPNFGKGDGTNFVFWEREREQKELYSLMKEELKENSSFEVFVSIDNHWVRIGGRDINENDLLVAFMIHPLNLESISNFFNGTLNGDCARNVSQ